VRILGIGGSVHDFSACVVVDGAVVSAIEEERISRIKHHPLYAIRGSDFESAAIEYCRQAVGVGIDDFDLIVSNDLIYRPMTRRIEPIEYINHHLAHASCTYYSSNLEEAAVLIADGFGSISDGRAETVSYFRGDGNHLERLWRLTGSVQLKGRQTQFTWRHFDYVEDSLGSLYGFVSEAIGFGPMEEGKTMGLSPYGRDRLYESLTALCELSPEGLIRFRRPQRQRLAEWIRQELETARSADELFQRKADFAFAVQRLAEEALLAHAHQLAEMSGSKALCLGGGLALNCLANYRLATETPFEQVWVHGAAGDSGTAIGAALWAQASQGGTVPRQSPGSIYGGREYTPAEIDEAIRSYPKVKAKVVDDPSDLAAQMIADGAVVGWFQGRSEFGPRALGNRSILADPRRASMKETINQKVKRREAFRPFAPAILAEAQEEYYGFTLDSSHMTFAPPIAEAHRGDLPAVTHVDGSSRIQTVSADSNQDFHHLISQVGARTGIPAVLNTSFNEQEPIVESPSDALSCFDRTAIDCLFIGDRFVTRDVVAGPH